MRSFTVIAALAAASTTTTSVTAMKWSPSEPRCDGNPFSNLKIDISCNSSDESDSSNTSIISRINSRGIGCALGDTATIQGNMYATSSFDSSGIVTLQACSLGYCPEMGTKDAGSICDDWITPTGGQECGEKGTYAVYHTEDIPTGEDIERNIPTVLSRIVLRTVKVHLKVGQEEECYVSEKLEAEDGDSSDYSTMSYSMVGFASIAMVGAAGYSSWKRRRDRKSIDTDAEETIKYDEEASLPYVEMGGTLVV